VGVTLRLPTRRSLVAAVVCLAVAVTMAVVLTGHAGAGESRCDEFRRAAAEPARTDLVTAPSGPRILVIGDSYSLGLGVDSGRSWPHQLQGRVLVDGFSGSGFSKDASACGDVSYASRAVAALRRAGDVSVVVVEGGLNDYDQPTSAIRRGFDRLLARLGERRVVVVGPASAPARAAEVPRIDHLLARLSARHGVQYVRMSGAALAYLPDRLHLIPASHRAFGDVVAGQIAD